MENMYIIAFHSTHHAIRFEKILKESDFNIRTIPTPREISASCGISIRFEEKETDRIIENLTINSIDYHGVFKISKNNGKKEIEKLG